MSEGEVVSDRALESGSETESAPPVPKQRPTLEKSATMWAAIIGIWALTIVLSLPFMATLLASAGTPVTLGLTAVIVLSLPVFWLFGVYNIVVTAVGYRSKTEPERIPYGVMEDREVAIVYPTYNDFMPGHLERSRHQSHENTHTYIVDDSTEEAVIAEIDDYATGDRDVTVVRREGREGFKAGGINHALETAIDEPFFVLMDADEVLPEEFVETTITYFAGDDVGFVQGNHDHNRETATRFGNHLGIGVDIHWDVYQPPRNAYGFVMLLGHGAIIRRDVWEEIGGFPEIVSEDLAFATRARRHGYKGVFAPEVDCLEDFPPDFRAFRRRHKKWTGGSIEYIYKKLPG
ncbi:MAG: cellulose synthase/poly-beta-1,6-N-acetylglucosamine synthase-like glycosyltransferase, partial [Haloarculaceae archaeon]